VATVALLSAGLFLVGLGGFMVLLPARFARLLRRALEGGRAVLRLLGVRRMHTVGAALHGVYNLEGAAVSGLVTIPEDASLDRQLAYLRARAVEAQEHLARLEQTVVEDRRLSQRELGELRDEMRAWVGGELDRALGAYLGLRVAGTFVALAGNALLAVASLI
jgi:hypothetical protein